MPNTKKTLLVLDANSLIHRAFHALPPLSTPKGEMVNAVYGFFLVFFKVLKELKPEYIAATFDAPGPTERHRKFKEYKATRVKAPDELYRQIALVKEALQRLGIPTYEKSGFEADDCMGTIAKLGPRRQIHPPLGAVIVSGDQDAFQLIDERTKIYTMRKGIQDAVLCDEETIREKFGGLASSQMIDYKALCGDPSDNIPGVTGIGKKTAIQLLKEFGSLENLYQSLEGGEAQDRIKPRVRELLRASKEQAFLSKSLVTINRDAPIDFRLEDSKWQNNPQNIKGVLERFGFQSLLSRLQSPTDAKAANAQLPLGVQTAHAQQGAQETIQDKIEQLCSDGIISKEIYELEKSLTPVLLKMEEVGIKIDKPYFLKLEAQVTKELKRLEKGIFKFAAKEFNINSPQQLSEALFQGLNLSPKGLRKTPGGVISTASEELEKLQEQHPIIKEVLQYRDFQKLYTTYIKPLPELADANDRLHTHFDQLGAATGRLSSSNPNLQNIPVQGEWGTKIRKGFIAERGKLFVAFDYSQMELRVAAHIARDEKMRQAFEEGQDIHRATAAEVFGVALEQVTREMRSRAKALNFGILYGMGARGFAQAAHVSFEEATNFIEQYFERFAGIAAYIEETKEFAREHGYTETIFGRRRYIPEINSTTQQFRAAAERIAINHPIQGSSADLMKMAMLKIFREVLPRFPRCSLLLQIHDELLFECPDDIIPVASPRIREAMEDISNLRAPLKVECKRGPSWGELT